MYHRAREQPHICLRGGVRFPTGGIVRERRELHEPVRFRYRQYSLDERRRVWHFVMLFFDAYTLEGNFRVFIIEKECFFMTQKQKTHRIAVAALLAAVAAVLQFVEFSIPIMPAFVKLDISDLPALLGTFSLGPVYGVAIQLVKNLLHLPFGSSACVGELSNFLLGATFALIAGIVYKKHKNRSGALWGSVAGAAAMALISLPLNYFIVYPAYVVLYGLPLEAIVGMYQEILGTVAQIPTGNALFNCLLVFNVPFTLCKGLLDVALCFLIYKPLSPLLHK